MAEAEFEVVSCPICRGTGFTTLATTDRYDMGLTTVGCNCCGFVITNPQPTGRALDQFYAQHYRRYYQKTDKPSVEYIRQYRKDDRAQYTVEYLRAHCVLRQGAAILDIGAAEGCILKAIRDVFPEARADAVEPSADFGDFAKSYAGCAVYRTLDELRTHGSKNYDLIIINHVLEHMKDPIGFLQSLKGLLSTPGFIYIDVPSIVDYARLDCLHIAHLCHFSESSLRRSVESAGYRVESMERHSPIMHPRSVRCLIRDSEQPEVRVFKFSREGWTNIKRAQRSALRYHRKRWRPAQRLRHLFDVLRYAFN